MSTTPNDVTQVNPLNIGWASVDITPEQKVVIAGQFYARVSEGVLDPISATVLVIESLKQGEQSDYAIFVTCDLVTLPDSLRNAIRTALRTELPQIDVMKVICHATHTHAGPEIQYEQDELQFSSGSTIYERYGVKLDVMEHRDYSNWIAVRIAKAIASAWNNRKAGGISHGLSHAVVSANRRVCYFDGTAMQYRNMNTPEYSHIEGPADHAVNLLYTWDLNRKLTGVAINLACPSQVSGGSFKISADYWCQTRQTLRKELGEHLNIISLNGPSGDLVPRTHHIDHNWRAQQRMWTLAGIDHRQDIAQRITTTVTSILPVMENAIQWELPLVHQSHSIELPKRKLTQDDVDTALKLAQGYHEQFLKLSAEIESDPSRKENPHWYTQLTQLYHQTLWNREVATRFEKQKEKPSLKIEVHIMRLGDIAFATNPFEYYLDYGWQIKSRSHAIQTFLVQLVGTGSYLPTERAVKGGGYGALPASTPVGPDGGRILADWTVQAVNAMFPESSV